MKPTPFGLALDDYWEAPWKNAIEVDEEYVFDKKWGLYIDAPPTINREERKTIPAPFLYVAQLREAYKVNLDTMTKVVACRLEDRAFFIDNALPPREWPGEPPVGKDSPDLTCSKFTLDIEQRLHLLNQPGTYKVVLLLQQQMSNVITTTIEPLPEKRSRDFSGELASPELLGHYTQFPAVPNEPGIVLAVDRVVLDSAGAAAALKGSFQLPVLAHEIVGPWPSAILPISIVILASGSAAETVLRLRVPAFNELDGDKPIATGTFAIDLMSIPGIRGRAQIYSAYAFCGEFMAGPALMATITEDMLPTGKQLR